MTDSNKPDKRPVWPDQPGTISHPPEDGLAHNMHPEEVFARLEAAADADAAQ